ncbi:MAG: endonuclease/exonuclease/phosphatase family protein [Parachlamydiales bacterium]|nr:endonuclease/exonuclease/phosphatase family protein [Parachlamydiales bacterium]
MKIFKLIFSLSITILIVFLLLSTAFLWWNNYPPLLNRSNPPIIKISEKNHRKVDIKNIKTASYNIHFGIGYNAKTLAIDELSYINRLNKIADVLKSIDADVVFLQEVDFASDRSFNINQAEYLAKNADYQYVAIAPTLRKKMHLNYNNVKGKIETGIAIISKYPIIYNEVLIFDYSYQMPFFMKWLFDPHGSQKCVIDFNNQKVNLINIHLEPWCSETRYSQMLKVKDIWLENAKHPVIVAGDFNTTFPAKFKKMPFHLLDAPFFIKKDSINYKNDKTLVLLKNLKHSEAVPAKLYLKNKNRYFTYPSMDPKVKIDYIFAGNRAKVIKGYVFHEAKLASDHLPIIAEIKINGN